MAPEIHSLEDYIAHKAAPQRLVSRSALGVGVTELLLAAMGLYALLLFTAAARTLPALRAARVQPAVALRDE